MALERSSRESALLPGCDLPVAVGPELPGTAGGPVVMREVCLDGRRIEAEFSPKDRSQLDYPMPLGRSALEGIALVDPTESFLGSGACPADGENHHTEPYREVQCVLRRSDPR